MAITIPRVNQTTPISDGVLDFGLLKEQRKAPTEIAEAIDRLNRTLAGLGG